MKKYQIVETSENFNHAGSKATKDIADIADTLGYSRINIRMNTTKLTKVAKVQRQVGYFHDWKNCEHEMEDNAVVLLQHPFHYPQMTRERTLLKLKEKKHIRFICLIHDVEELRAFRYNEYYRKEFEFMIKIADAFIVHNDVMMKYFLDLGIPRTRVVNLEIFDYLQKSEMSGNPKYEKAITIAGNLDTTKCGYIGQLGKLCGVDVKLFGPNFDEQLKSYANIHYYGSFPADEIPSKLTGGFGLVWDGKSIDGCIGQSGQYLKYNNPHKLSLYLSSGIPVVTWKGAAEAAFVEKHNVGICVESLLELTEIFETMNQDVYLRYAAAARQLAPQLRSGQYGKEALLKAEKIVNC